MEKLTGFGERGSESDANADQSANTDELFAQVRATVEKLERNFRPAISSSSRSNHEDSSGSSKFIDDLMYDPITYELMVDPVKGSDGRTYDRWTIINNDLRLSPFTQEQLSILCDDINLRSCLFEIFRAQNLQEKFLKLRQEYRRTTLELVEGDQYGEALERLEHVLKWDPKDSECQELRRELPDRLKKLQSHAESTSTTFLGSSGSDLDHAVVAVKPDSLDGVDGVDGEARTGAPTGSSLSSSHAEVREFSSSSPTETVLARKSTSSSSQFELDVMVSVDMDSLARRDLEGRTEASSEPGLNRDPSGDVEISLPPRHLLSEESVCWTVTKIIGFGICYIPFALLVTVLIPLIFLWSFVIDGKTVKEILVDFPDVYCCRFDDDDD